MGSVRFNYVEPWSLPHVEEVLCKGDRASFVGLIGEIIADPDGRAALAVERLWAVARLDDPDFPAQESCLAAHHLVQAMRQFRSPGGRTRGSS